MKTPFTYVTLRYVHDVVTGEFANVGVALYAPEKRLLASRFTTSYERLNAMFVRVDHAHFRSLMKYLDNRFAEVAEEIRDGFECPALSALPEMVRRILPADDSSLQWSNPGGGLSADLESTLNEIFGRMVSRYVRDNELPSRGDDEIARPFKAVLERKHVAQKLRQKKIETKDYQYEFQFGWKNSVWHVYEPVSFDLMNPASIVEKATAWLGRGTALSEANEKFQMHFLLGQPKQPKTEKAYEDALHLLKKIPGNPELVPEAKLPEFAEEVAQKIAAHEREESGILREEPPTCE